LLWATESLHIPRGTSKAGNLTILNRQEDFKEKIYALDELLDK